MEEKEIEGGKIISFGLEEFIEKYHPQSLLFVEDTSRELELDGDKIRRLMSRAEVYGVRTDLVKARTDQEGYHVDVPYDFNNAFDYVICAVGCRCCMSRDIISTSIRKFGRDRYILATISGGSDEKEFEMGIEKQLSHRPYGCPRPKEIIRRINVNK